MGLDGTYLFEHVVPGEYIIIPYLDGYLSPFDKLTLPPADTTIAALFEKIVVAQGSLKVGAQGTQTFNISLERGATVSGRVLYSDGSPAIQVGIELQNTADPSPRPGSPYIQLGDIARSEFVHSAPETDDQGHFRIAGIRPGTYRIAAIQLQKLPMQPDETLVRSILGALRFYTNDTVHPGSAKAYSLAAGQELTGLDIRISTASTVCRARLSRRMAGRSRARKSPSPRPPTRRCTFWPRFRGFLPLRPSFRPEPTRPPCPMEILRLR